ncbi:uncharacterized protein [Ptychodera flava]|uniref:uncharacterized protein n=1 Tax=Ptychodera flava TaxID=63121 RepID=UPI00396A6AE1
MTDSLSFQTRLWLINNYHVVPGEETTLKDITQHIEWATQHSNLQSVRQENRVGSFIREIWADQISIKRRFIPHTKQRTRIYTNLSKINKDSSSPDMHYMTWNRLKYYSPSGWSVASINEDCVAWIKMSTNEDTVNSCRILTEVHIRRNGDNLSVVVKYGSHSINLDDIGFQASEFFSAEGITSQNINALLTMVCNTALCPGIEWHEHSGMKFIKTEVWKTSEKEILRLRSSDCELFCKNFSTYCTKCHYLKRRLHAKRALHDIDSNNTKRNMESMDREELMDKIKEEKRLRRNAEAREKYLRKKLHDEMIEFGTEDHEDFKKMLQLIDEKRLGSDMKILLQQQKQCLKQKSVNAYRWHPRIIRLCLSIYSRSPHAYDELAKVLILPSKRTLVYKKNKNPQEPGWTFASMQDLKRAADDKGLKDVDRYGGLCFDEMAIQSDLQLIKSQGKSKLVGVVSLGDAAEDLDHLMKGEINVQTATHVLQFVFIGDGGFRYPVAHFPTKECSPAILYRVFWDGVQMLLKAGFHVYWSCCDGGESNRGFINLHFKETTPRDSNFTTRNPLTGGKMIFIMDPKHNIKKIRNNLEKSRRTGKSVLKYNGHEIVWNHWYNTYTEDQRANSIVVHERLTEEHFDLNAKSKMRNHLAEDVLDRKMLFAMQAYKRSLIERRGEDVSYLNGSIQLLSHTSKLVSFVNDIKNPVRDTADTRLKDSRNFLTYLDTWHKSEQPTHFISSKLYFDLQSHIIGFEQLCKYKLDLFPGSTIMPGIVNQDVVENIFCQARSHHGQNNNPTYDKYCKSQNTIIFGQNSISRKGNASVTF